MKKKFFPLFILLAATGLHGEEEKRALATSTSAHVEEAPLPQDWPGPGPYGEVTEKLYPAYRAAFTNGKGETSSFGTLFQHIKKRDIPTSSSVEIALSTREGKFEQSSMAFLYQNGKVGSTGPDGAKVEVKDVPAARTLSYRWQGNDSKEKIAVAKTALESALAEKKTEARGFRLLGYNGPDTPREKRTWELQALIE